MERSEYERLAALDRRLWWFRGLHAQMAGALARQGDTMVRGRVLDAGCGTGGLLATLAERMPRAQLFGLELDQIAASVARAASGRPVCGGSVTALPFGNSTFAARSASPLSKANRDVRATRTSRVGSSRAYSRAS